MASLDSNVLTRETLKHKDETIIFLGQRIVSDNKPPVCEKTRTTLESALGPQPTARAI